MELKWEWFTSAYELMRYVNKYHIKKENIQGIFVRGSNYDLLYWVS